MTIIPLCILISLLGWASVLEVQPAEVLPETSALRLQGDLFLQVREGIDQFPLLEIDRSVEKRQTATLGMFALAGFAAEDPPAADKFPIDPGISCAAASEKPPSEFRIQLSSEQEKRAASLYRKSIVITAHDHCVTGDDFRDTARAGISARVIKPIVDGHYPAGGTRYPIEAEVA